MREIIFGNSNVKLDTGLFFGKGVFETILVNKQPLFLKEHINRINEAIKNFDLGSEVDYNEVKEFIVNNNIKNQVFKITVTEENLIFTTREIIYTKNHYKQGFKVKFSQVLRNSTSRLVNFKTLNYLENIIEYEVCKKENYNEAIFFNERGELCEGCTTNIFIIKDNYIFTPKVESGLLPGIVRQWIMDNFPVIEKNISKDELLNSDEIFLTNSLVGVIKVSNIEDKTFNWNIGRVIKNQYDEAISGGNSNE